MSALLLAFNVGSSSLKFQAAPADAPTEALLSGTIDRVGTEDARLRLASPGEAEVTSPCAAPDQAATLHAAADAISQQLPGRAVIGAGHRVVHGGPHLDTPCVIDAALVAQLEALIPLAPLHLPPSLKGIAAAQSLFPGARHVACFDTGFHAGKPFAHDSFALPRAQYDAGLRRYGFHGLSCQSIMRSLQAEGYPAEDRRIAIAHLGNGCSVTAVRDGRSLSNSMGFSTLDGLVMGTRCGRIDPGVLLHLLRDGMSPADLERLLYHDSGLRGISGLSNDMRDLLASDTQAARDAIEIFTTRIAEEVARTAAVMGGLDTLIFCGGIGENAPDIRTAVTNALAFLPDLEVLVRETREEEEILCATADLVA
ncbi:acetate/propionate family kinase [Allosediminivita pacifica]|uniref:Acetate kinase n=1 Tax=Allosediminivita pacifica TaxID=1267769 RepID=A0A2T6AS91_9RHOB|nr:acetate kinase [Allosediminivita pacifica]PTX46689.1 acetate kinase [Allosediminivita pacifica]GGB16081.1 acetate kinase [Allosediminivita pacifica]